MTAVDRSTRAALLRRTAIAGGAALAGGVAAGGLPGPVSSAASAAQDRRSLNLVLLLEQIEAAFYARALADAPLRGELREYAMTVEPHERAHVAFLTKVLGRAARRPPKLDFGAATTDPKRFMAAAVRLEDTVVAAYNGQAANLTQESLGAAARIVSVEARHAGWIRAIAGSSPAPGSSDPLRSEAAVMAALRGTGWLRS